MPRQRWTGRCYRLPTARDDGDLVDAWFALALLDKKTAGNLTPSEKRMLEGLLSDLRMQYVSLINSPQQARGFSGSDITGGR